MYVKSKLLTRYFLGCDYIRSHHNHQASNDRRDMPLIYTSISYKAPFRETEAV